MDRHNVGPAGRCILDGQVGTASGRAAGHSLAVHRVQVADELEVDYSLRVQVGMGCLEEDMESVRRIVDRGGRHTAVEERELHSRERELHID